MRSGFRGAFFMPKEHTMLFNRNPLELRDDLAQNQNDDLFGRVRPNTKQDAAIADLSEPHKLSAPVGEQGQNQRRDVAKTELLLGHAGTLDLDQTEGPTGYWGERTRQATRAFQKQHRLKVDGRINPGGETIRALATLAGGAIRAFSGQKMPAVTAPVPEPSKTPASFMRRLIDN
jgi:peptidoglycan hydrolase-like protein with peptidoglycan-binding domain